MVGTCGAAFRVSWVHTTNVRTKPRRWRRLPPCGNSYPPALTQSYSFYYIYQTPYPLFLWERRLKEKANKKKRQRGDAKRGLFEKSPLLTPAKTFRQLPPECRASAPKASYQPIRPAARRFLKKAPFKSPKNFRTLSPVIRRAHPKLRTSLFAPPQGGAGMLGAPFIVLTFPQSNRKGYKNRRWKAARRGCRRGVLPQSPGWCNPL